VDGRGVDLDRRKILFSFSSVQTSLGAHSASYTMDAGSCREAGHEANNSPPPGIEVKNGGAIPPLPNTSSWLGA
jgi:hypothetical protein